MAMLEIAPEHTAVRVALWRALHLEVDGEPHVLEDRYGPLLSGEENWRERGDMSPEWTKRLRPSIVARARFIEDLVLEEYKNGLDQFVILGAGLDSFALRHKNLSSLKVFEVDQPGPQKWKEERLKALNIEMPNNLVFVPVDFEVNESWWEKLQNYGFDPSKPALIASTGVSMYLTKEANLKTLEELAKLAPGSVVASTYMLPLELLEDEDKPMLEFTIQKTKEAGTPFISFFSPEEIKALAKKAGFKSSYTFSVEEMRQRYFKGRDDGLSPGSGEYFLVGRM